MVVDFNSAGECARLRVDEPACLPLAAPKGVKIGVDAADVDLQVAILVEAQARSCRSLAVVLSDVSVDRSLDSRSIEKEIC